MEELGPDILFFPKILGGDLFEDLNLLVNSNYKDINNRELREAVFPFEGIRGRIEIYKHPELFQKFNDFWFAKIEDQMYDYYFKYILDNDKINGYKQHSRTEWKDIFIQVYNVNNTFKYSSNTHCDFSGLTFIACLKDEYEGGVLILPKQNVKIKLSKGDLVLFPGSHTHPHGLTQLISGERIVLVGQSMGVKQTHQFGKEI